MRLAQHSENRMPPMRYAIVTETWPPEVNGVALTVHALAQGLRARGRAVSIVRPRQVPGQSTEPDTMLVRGAGLPRYPGLKFGFPATGKLTRLWTDAPPDAIYVATEGPSAGRLCAPRLVSARQWLGCSQRLS